MPRHARREVAGALHHVTARSRSGRLLFNSDHDRQLYLQLLTREVRERGWRVLTFCLLSNHLHLLVRTPDPDLGEGLKGVHGTFSQRINRSRGEGGHLFGERFYNGIVATDRHALGCLRYIARNPVEAGICREPHEWPWSAHRALAGMAPPPRLLDVGAAYEHLGKDAGEARRSYLELVGASNARLVERLIAQGRDDWVAAAHHDFAIPITELAACLAVSRDTVYRRLRACN